MPSGVSTSSWSKPDPDPPPLPSEPRGLEEKFPSRGLTATQPKRKEKRKKKKTNTEAKPEPLTTAKALRELAANPSLERTLQRNFPRPESPRREEALKLNFFFVCFVWEAGIPNPGRDAQIFIITVLPHVVHTRSCCLGCGGAAATGPGEQSPATAATAAGSSPNSPVPPSPAEPPPAKPAAHT